MYPLTERRPRPVSPGFTYAGFGAYGISNGSRRFQLGAGYLWEMSMKRRLSGESITECFILYVRTLGKITVW